MPSQKISYDAQDLSELLYPGAKGWMWNYCVYLGPFTDSLGHKYDLGIYQDHNGSPSYAIVYSNECGDYFSGSLEECRAYTEAHVETQRRYDVWLKE